MSSRVLINRHTPMSNVFVDCESRTDVTYQSILDRITKCDLSGPFIIIDSCTGIEDHEEGIENSECRSCESASDSCS